MHGKIPLRIAQTTAQTSEAPAESDAIDLRQIQDFFWRRWRLILTATAAVMILTFLALLTVTPRYTATAQVLLEPRKEKIFGANQNVLPEFNLDAANVDSQLTVIQSLNLLRRVVVKEKLYQDPEFGPQPPGLFSYITGLFTRDDTEKGALQQSDNTILPAILGSIGRLRNALDVQRVNKTLVLAISVTSREPNKAARLANAIADAYVVGSIERALRGRQTRLNLARQAHGGDARASARFRRGCRQVSQGQ